MLTDTQCRTAKAADKPLKLRDGNGLYLEVRPNGSKLWRYRYEIGGKENLFALGSYCQPPAGESQKEAQARRDARQFTLAEARVERERCRGLVKQSIHPSHSQQTDRLRRSLEAESTFQAVAETWIRENESHWSANYLRQIKQRLSGDAFPWIGALPIKSVTPAHVKDVLKRLEKRGSPASAKLLKTWIGGVFRYAAGELLVEADPTWPLRNTLKAPKTQHIAHLATKEIPAFLRALEDVQAENATKAAAKLLWLTVVRTVELRCAEWQEFDLEAGLWTVPAERMKMREAHTVPLSFQAVEILRGMQALTGRGRYVFPGRKDREQPLTHEGIRDVFNRAGYAGKFTPHGVRGTFSTFFNEAGADHEVIELCLAHAERNKVRGAYNHAKKLDQRRALMQQWADLTEAWIKGADVVPLRSNGAL
ncbi:integrase [Azospira sp. I13]|uniref:tyrosine-type recombinase/integrase n=1 Tax=Azospira sp. I13 TaxID=1765050 RepID=UPI000D48ED68|nr:tyrosine-type recombinase/integrase [Azospira sp. I13]GBG02537.1 integrase [Azospira sp. I13]